MGEERGLLHGNFLISLSPYVKIGLKIDLKEIHKLVIVLHKVSPVSQRKDYVYHAYLQGKSLTITWLIFNKISTNSNKKVTEQR